MCPLAGDAEVAEILRSARRRAGLSQQRLALRAGTSQDAVSRIERGVESPGLERLRRLLRAAGQELRVTSEPLAAAAGALNGAASMSPSERLRESASWNLVATRLEIAGAEARESGHPATLRGPNPR